MKLILKKVLAYVSVTIIGAGLIFILIETIIAKNTGFETKNLWDWLELLIVPLVIAFGAYYLNRSERAIEREIAAERQQEVALQTYFDRISDLLIKENLKITNDEVRNVIRIRTLTVLRGLDATRKRYVILFLIESGLIDSQKETGISLVGADLRKIDLSHSSLFHANLSGANLSYANLEGAYLDATYFYSSILIGANLRKIDFTGQQGPSLESSVVDADLSLADLTSTRISSDQLKSVKSLSGAILPNGKHSN